MEKRDLKMVLTKIMEECGELTQICSKIIFYGIDNVSPKADNPSNACNRIKLIEEVGDILANIKVLIDDTDAGVKWSEVYDREEEKYKKLEYILPEA